VSGSGAVSRHSKKMLERERSVERETAERERSGERVSQKQAWAPSGKSAAHAPITALLVSRLTPPKNSFVPNFLSYRILLTDMTQQVKEIIWVPPVPYACTLGSSLMTPVGAVHRSVFSFFPCELSCHVLLECSAPCFIGASSSSSSVSLVHVTAVFGGRWLSRRGPTRRNLANKFLHMVIKL